jgi:hypothetical protein
MLRPARWRLAPRPSWQFPQPKLRSMTGRDRGSDMGEAELAKLAAELDVRAYEIRLVASQGRRPYLHVRNRAADVLTEDVYLR